MRKKTRNNKIIPKACKKNSLDARKIDYGGVEWIGDDQGYIKPLWGPRPNGVIMPSGRALPRNHADRSRASGRFILTVWLLVAASFRTYPDPIRMTKLHRPDVKSDCPDAPH
jgi:hypothetical protein